MSNIQHKTDKILYFPNAAGRRIAKLDRLDELKRQYLELQAIQEEIIEEAFELTGEAERNGHTWDFFANSLNLTAAELFANMHANPSDLWLSMDSHAIDVLDDDLIF